MNENAIGIRVEPEFLKKIEKLGKEESMDRSTAMRMLLEQGYKSHMKKKAAEKYRQGKTTMSAAAGEAGLTIWEFEQYMIATGYKSQYSIEDLKEETGER
ncbi:MAG TPA: hypothetical protein HA254_00075 [Candidatus Diapherotrites archaeon]|uniref:Uncharacterized protein n=1 Tax=Candidatus Iainarchaeum sp. TaxID=3101447 RepID=A0A7J4IZ33_9ARCH|nr:hypothetical protein [Candidatus Diapherotrites archaeon]